MVDFFFFFMFKCKNVGKVTETPYNKLCNFSFLKYVNACRKLAIYEYILFKYILINLCSGHKTS